MKDVTDFEIAYRKELIKRLEYPMKQLEAALKKEEQKEEAHKKKLAQYSDEYEALDAYGYGFITEAEYERIKKIFSGEDTRELSVIEAARAELSDFIFKLEGDVRSLEWSKLSPEKQAEIERKNEERKAEIKRRKYEI
jgi:hypothetical protein